VAEDNPVNQTVIVHMLTNLGHQPTIAQTGKEALAILRQESFDLIFMDVQMPEMDGISATRRIRADEQRTGLHIPIVAITAHAMKGDKENCLSAGMDAYLAKPVTGREIKETIERFMSVPGSPREQTSSSSRSPSGALAKLDGDNALLCELVRIFIEESPKQLSKLRQAVEANDFETIERTAHGLKGELKYLGLAEAAQKASGFERFGREKCLQLPADSLSNLEADIINVTGCMKQMLEDKRTLN
jgi:CheY-like chemotaxis protein